ncbi:MAG TPA: hypothetical protein VHX14_08720 [Thermoanaerobaculia bacterium]|nr:hypothetical protein [Thermoanaerobaculia bacterium]
MTCTFTIDAIVFDWLTVSKSCRRCPNCFVPQGLTRLDRYGDSYPTFSHKAHFHG